MIKVILRDRLDKGLVEEPLEKLDPTYEFRGKGKLGAEYLTVLELVVIPILVSASYDLLKTALSNIIEKFRNEEREYRIILSCEKTKIVFEDNDLISIENEKLALETVDNALDYIKKKNEQA